MKKNISILLFFVFLCQPFNGQSLLPKEEKRYYYKIKRQENLSEVLYSMGYSPLYGKDGYIRKTLLLNPKSFKESGDLVFPNTKVSLPDSPIYTCNVEYNKREVRYLTKITSKRDLQIWQKENEKQCQVSIVTEDKAASSSTQKVVDTPLIQKQIEDIPEPAFQPSSEFSLLLLSEYSNIYLKDNSNDTDGNVLSDLGAGIQLSWEQRWSKSFSTMSSLEWKKINYSSTDERAFSDGNESLSKVELQAKFFRGSWSLLSGISYGEELFMFAPSSASLRLDKSQVLGAKIGIGKELFRLDPFTLLAEFGMDYVFSSTVDDYKSKSANGYFANIRLYHSWKKIKFFEQLGYEMQTRDTEGFDQLHRNLNFGFGISLDFGSN